MNIAFYFFITFLLSVFLTLLVRQAALKLRIIDIPDEARKKHKSPTPLLGGVAIFLSFWLVAGYFLFIHPIYGTELLAGKMLGVFLAGLVLIILGAIDDKKHISPWWRLLVTAGAALLAVGGGLDLDKITNPWGGVFDLNFLPLKIGGNTFYLLADILVFVWLMGMMYTTKILDGLDGLSAGTVFIGALVIFLLSFSTKYYQPNVAILSLIFAASCLGFLFFNFYPAKIFLGEGGSLFIGLLLAVLAVISGGKVATALLVMAIPVLDLARVVYVRIKKKQSIFKGDREHLHFRLVDAGLSQRQAVLLLYVLAFFFGITALFLQSIEKMYALVVLVVLMAIISHLIGRNKKYEGTKTF